MAVVILTNNKGYCRNNGRAVVDVKLSCHCLLFTDSNYDINVRNIVSFDDITPTSSRRAVGERMHLSLLIYYHHKSHQ